MKFEKTSIEGAWLITPEQFADNRGFLARTWGRDVFDEHGLDMAVVQRNMSYNHEKGTVRGMHFQRAPYTEIKLVSCIVGAIFDVAVDLRPASPTFGKWFGAELRAQDGLMLYVPEGCAHGYQTLEPNVSVEYLLSDFYHPEVSGGVRWNDPFFGISWPIEVTAMNERDRSWPDFRP